MFEFIKQFMKHPMKIGAISPSSRYLAQRMLDGIDVNACKYIVEYGPGTGVFTKEILKRKNETAIFLIIEQNIKFYNLLVKQYGKLKNVHIVNGTVENIDLYLKEYKIPFVDVIVSGIPFTSLPKEATNRILDKTTRILNKEGKFITFQYSLVQKHIFKEYFQIIKCKFEICNIPPAFVFVMKKR